MRKLLWPSQKSWTLLSVSLNKENKFCSPSSKDANNSNKGSKHSNWVNHLRQMRFTQQNTWAKLTSVTAMRILERCGIKISSLFVKIWLVCIPEFKANFYLYSDSTHTLSWSQISSGLISFCGFEPHLRTYFFSEIWY